MKSACAFFLVLFASNVVSAESPAFIKTGGVYAFLFAGKNPVTDRLIASVVKDEGAGWLKISTVEKKEELWINLGQVQAILPVSGGIEALQAAMQQKKILSNLREISAGADQFFLETGKVPYSFDELVSRPGYVRPIETVDGEDYRALDFSGNKPLRVRTKEGIELVYPIK